MSKYSLKKKEKKKENYNNNLGNFISQHGLRKTQAGKTEGMFTEV